MEKIQASIRIRPTKPTEGNPLAFTKQGRCTITAEKHQENFEFEAVYNEKSSNLDIFEGSVHELLKNALQGYNGIFIDNRLVCIFTYG